MTAGYIDRTATSTLTTFHYDVIGTVSAGTGSVIYSNKKTFDTVSKDVKEYYAHVMYKIGGTDYHGAEPDIDLSKESIMDFLSLTVSAFGYDGKTLDTITGEAHTLTRAGLEAMVEYKRLALVFGQQQGVNKETGADVKSTGNIVDITYNIGPTLAAVLRYQYTSVDNGQKTKDIYPAIVYAPRQTVKFQVYCEQTKPGRRMVRNPPRQRPTCSHRSCSKNATDIDNGDCIHFACVIRREILERDSTPTGGYIKKAGDRI